MKENGASHINYTYLLLQVWKRRWVVVRRPYVFLFREERDPCERGIINLARANTEYSDPTSNSASAKSSANHQEIVSAVGFSYLYYLFASFSYYR